MHKFLVKIEFLVNNNPPLTLNYIFQKQPATTKNDRKKTTTSNIFVGKAQMSYCCFGFCPSDNIGGTEN